RTANSGGHRTKWRLASPKNLGAFSMRSAAKKSVATVAPVFRRQGLANPPPVFAFDVRKGCCATPLFPPFINALGHNRVQTVGHCRSRGHAVRVEVMVGDQARQKGPFSRQNRCVIRSAVGQRHSAVTVINSTSPAGSRIRRVSFSASPSEGGQHR